MDVTLLIYDLSRGMARQMSMGLLGFQLDAIYHTSIKLQGREYVYDGSIVSIVPGSSHLGRPMQEILLGRTELPMDVIEEYLDSLREIYTVEAYDLWRHNCNNFSNDFAMFLLGQGIPSHVTNMPQSVLDSPFGQMLMPMLDQQIMARKRQGGVLGIEDTPGSAVKPKAELHHHVAQVQHAHSLAELNGFLDRAKNSCAVIFFTSATCPPCKMVYPLYDELAAEVGDKGVLIKVDTSHAPDAARQYQITATPTFITFLKGKQEDRWMGADPSKLRGNVTLLAQMAFPPHPHQGLNLPSLSNPDLKPVLFTKLPPLPKLLAKMGPTATEPSVKAIAKFIETRSSSGPAEATLPDIPSFTTTLRASLTFLPPTTLFTLVDLLRLALVDSRVSAFLAEDESPPHHTILSLLTHINSLPSGSLPYALRLVTLQTACNLFSSPLYASAVLSRPDLRSQITSLISSSFLDSDHSNIRVAAASLLFNLALVNNQQRNSGPGDRLPEAEQIELAAAVLEAITQEKESREALEGMVLALGLLAYRMDLQGELADLLRMMEAREVVGEKGKVKGFEGVGVLKEIGGELLGKGLRRP